jgi:hypothetical protein
VSGRPGEVPENCRSEFPPMGEVAANHFAACWYPVQEDGELHTMAKQ